MGQNACHMPSHSNRVDVTNSSPHPGASLSRKITLFIRPPTSSTIAYRPHANWPALLQRMLSATSRRQHALIPPSHRQHFTALTHSYPSRALPQCCSLNGNRDNNTQGECEAPAANTDVWACFKHVHICNAVRQISTYPTPPSSPGPIPPPSPSPSLVPPWPGP